jgi:hypothetical protein
MRHSAFRCVYWAGRAGTLMPFGQNTLRHNKGVFMALILWGGLQPAKWPTCSTKNDVV